MRRKHATKPIPHILYPGSETARKNESTKRELLQKLNLTHNKLYRSLDRLQLDGLVAKEMKDGKEYYKLTEKGKEYLELLKKLVNS